MDIRNWPLDRIMQLPDCCFGSRWPIVFSGWLSDTGDQYLISELSLPDRCVLWELWCWGSQPTEFGESKRWMFSFKLGDHLPVNNAAFVPMEDIFPGWDYIDIGARSIIGMLELARLKIPIQSQGRRVVLRYEKPTIGTGNFVVGLVFSSIPTEVPDCLLSV